MFAEVSELTRLAAFDLARHLVCPFLVPKSKNVYDFWDEDDAQVWVMAFLREVLQAEAIFGEDTERHYEGGYALMGLRSGDKAILFSPVTLRCTVLSPEALSAAWYMAANPGLTGADLMEALPESEFFFLNEGE